MRLCVVSSCADETLRDWASLQKLSEISIGGFARLFSGNITESDMLLADQWLREHGYDRLFENHYFPRSISEAHRKQLVHAFFSKIGNIYDHVIDPIINISCYEALINGALKKSNKDVAQTHLLDIGCGPGTILSNKTAQSMQSIVGFDFVDANLSLASHRGLTVVDQKQLELLSPASFDIFISTFVLHYQSLSERDILSLTRLLKNNGIWAGNFHKSIGTDWFIQLLHRCGGFSPILDLTESPYGPLIFARRVT